MAIQIFDQKAIVNDLREQIAKETHNNLYTDEQAARKWGCSTSTIYRFRLCEGILPPAKRQSALRLIEINRLIENEVNTKIVLSDDAIGEALGFNGDSVRFLRRINNIPALHKRARRIKGCFANSITSDPKNDIAEHAALIKNSEQ